MVNCKYLCPLDEFTCCFECGLKDECDEVCGHYGDYVNFNREFNPSKCENADNERTS